MGYLCRCPTGEFQARRVAKAVSASRRAKAGSEALPYLEVLVGFPLAEGNEVEQDQPARSPRLFAAKDRL